MEVEVHIPDSVAQAIRPPEERIEQEILQELALSFYARGLLSFGKARELARMGPYEFGQALGRRGIPRHYGPEELDDDLLYACRE